MRSRLRTVRTALLLLSIVAVVSACRVDSTVTIDVDPEGSGTVHVDVTADRSAADALGDPGTALRLDDLVESGWQIDEPVIDPDEGGFTLSGSHEFRSGEELAKLLAGLGLNHSDAADVDDVPFVDDVTLGISSGSGRTGYDFAARLRMDAGPGVVSDPALTEVLGGLQLGRTPEELQAAGFDPAVGFGNLTIRLSLPGGIDETSGRIDGRYVEWSVPVGSNAAIDQKLTATTTSVDRRPMQIRVIGLAVLAVAVALTVVGFARRH